MHTDPFSKIVDTDYNLQVNWGAGRVQEGKVGRINPQEEFVFEFF